ncbi:hypothetical protein M5689_021614 [Euphorbia peplus]|nr:hypothetical protein M5689_021614 [Euphorbia peplus]
MEVKKAAMVLMVLSVAFIGQSSCSTFGDCYKGCFIICVITPGTTLFSCGTKCLKDCICPSTNNSSLNSLNNPQQTHFFCKYGCALSLCTTLSSKNDPGEKKVEKCVNSCSVRCVENYKT